MSPLLLFRFWGTAGEQFTQKQKNNLPFPTSQLESMVFHRSWADREFLLVLDVAVTLTGHIQLSTLCHITGSTASNRQS